MDQIFKMEKTGLMLYPYEVISLGIILKIYNKRRNLILFFYDVYLKIFFVKK